MKRCTVCELDLPIESFGSNGKRVRSRCRECDYDAKLFQKYGITRAQYNALLEDQNYSCAMCNTHQMELDRKLDVDHDHEMDGIDSVRGLLCNNCNRGLGLIGDNLESAKMALRYMESFYSDADSTSNADATSSGLQVVVSN